MKTSTQRCSQRNWRTFLAGSFKSFLVLFLLSFLTPNLNAQITINGSTNDWQNYFCTGTSAGGSNVGVGVKKHVPDPFGTGVLDDQFTQGTKDITPVPDWRWARGQTKKKNDIANAAALISADGCTLYFAGDRSANEGAAQIGFWFFVGGTAPQEGGTFSPDHSNGDILILADFSAGGRDATVKTYMWMNGELVPVTGAEAFVAQNNNSEEPVPACWQFGETTYDYNQFFEGSLNLCQLGIANTCFTSFLFEARSSPSLTASLDDFAAGEFDVRPEAPTVPAVSRCGAGVVTLTATCASARWYDVAVGGTVLHTGATYSPNLTETKTFYVSCANVFPRTSGDLVCESDRTAVTATINAAATVQAGLPITVCQSASPSPITLTGASVGGSATTGAWSIISGGGLLSSTSQTGSPSTVTYTPAANFYGTVTLRLTTNDPAGDCPAVWAERTITVNQAATANAGGTLTVCQSTSTQVVNLTGASVGGGATSGTWSFVSSNPAGGGSVTNNTLASGAFTVAANYHGSITVRLTTNDPDGAGPCAAVTADRTIVVNQAATANAGGTLTVCQSTSTQVVNLTGASVGGGANTGTWSFVSSSPGGGGSVTNSSLASGSFTVAANYAGTITVRLTTNDPDGAGPCTAVTADRNIVVNERATANAGGPYTMCAASTSVQLVGTYGGGSTGGVWSGGAGTFGTPTTNTTLKTVTVNYTPTVAEKTAGSVQLTFTANDPDGAGPCTSVSQNVTLTITTTPPPHLAVVNNCDNSTITAYISSGSSTLVPAGQLTWSNGMTGNPIHVTTTTAVTAIRTIDGCPSVNSNSVNPAPIGRPGAPGGVPRSACIGQTVTLSATGCAGTYRWYATNSSTTVLHTGATFTTPALNMSTTYYVSCTVNNCEGPRTAVTATVEDCGRYCTYTQGYYGNAGGKSCDGTTGGLSTIELIRRAIDGWDGVRGNSAGTLTVGSGTNAVTITYADAQRVIDYLPGGGQSYTLSSPSVSINSSVFVDRYTTTVGGGKIKINNTLLAQTITLGLNMGLSLNTSNDLSSFSFANHTATNRFLITQELATCGGTGVVENSYTCDEINTAVVALLKQSAWPVSGGGDFPATVGGLFRLANYALSGGSLAGTGVTLSAIADAVDAINNAFDECRAFVAWAPSCAGYETTTRVTPNEVVEEVSISVSASPNPFRDRIRFVISSKISGQGSLEIYNTSGQRIAVPFQGHVEAGSDRTVDFSVPSAQRANLIYMMRVKDKSVSGKLINGER